MTSQDFERWEREGFRDKRMLQWSELRQEISTFHENLVIPAMQHPFDSPFRQTCRAYVMTCFSWIDLLAAYWNRAGIPSNQSQRMTVFMNAYMGIATKNASVAIHAWRHPLAHEAGIRVVDDATTRYVPFETWQVTADKHMALIEAGTWSDATQQGPKRVRRVSLGLFNLVDDVERGMTNYFDALAIDPVLQQRFRDEDNRIATAAF